MGRSLNGAELASFIKVRQAKQVRRLKQADGIAPRLAIIMTSQPNPVIETYVQLKQTYGQDIGIDVSIERCDDDDMPDAIERLNHDASVQAVVVQLPLSDPSKTAHVVNQITPAKDVDGLGRTAQFISATAEAIDWLLAGYGVELAGKRIVLVGRGKLVGRPLEVLWRSRGLDVSVLDNDTKDIAAPLSLAEIIISATGQAGLITSGMVAAGAVVVDAGTVSEDGKIVGDIAADLRQRNDVILTPERGGVGPLTVAMMFDHVIRAADTLVEQQKLQITA